jgi:hypothetical protein
MGLSLDGRDLAALARIYVERCHDAGAMPEYSISHDEECGLASDALEALAVASMRAQLER